MIVSTVPFLMHTFAAEKKRLYYWERCVWKNSVVTYHKKYVTHLLKLKNDFHSFIAAIHPLTLLSLFDYFLSRSDRGWTYLSEMNINKRKYADR